MQAPTKTAPSSGPWERRSRFGMRLLFAAALALAALRIVDYGFIPPDDALRHVATVVSDRPYSEVLVFGEGVPAVDSTPGWHDFLGAVHHLLGLDKFGLVSFSVFFLFVVFGAVPLFLLRRPEAWGIAFLLNLVIAPSAAVRLALGRPFLLMSTALVVFVLCWDRLVADPRDRRALVLCAAAAAVGTWLYSTWFLLYSVPLASLFSGRWRASAALLASVSAGVLLGALLTLQPVAHLVYPVIHVWKTMGTTPEPFLTSELRPFSGGGLYMLLLLLLLVARGALPELKDLSLRHAGFLTVLSAWVLGFVTSRFWTDIGLPALLAVTALALQHVLVARLPWRSADRWLLGAAAALAIYLGVSANHGGRWEDSPLFRAWYFRENPGETAAWLPGPGGTLYSEDARIFYAFYFTYPDAEWRYILGPEPGIMPAEDRAVVADVFEGEGWDAFLPWVEELGPRDRIFFVVPAGARLPRWEGTDVRRLPFGYGVARQAGSGGSDGREGGEG